MLPAKPKTTQPASKSTFFRALDRFQARQKKEEPPPIVRLGFLIDATASREENWEHARGLQDSMFRAVAGLGPLTLRLMHFGGLQLVDHGWMDGPREVAAAMARVRCKSGYTKFLPGLASFLNEPEGKRAAAIILIGDCFEECPREAEQLARQLKEAGVRVHCFLEGKDWTAESVFRGIAGLTGGVFARLGDTLPLEALCEGVALLTAGGAEAVQRVAHATVRNLLLAGPQGTTSVTKGKR